MRKWLRRGIWTLVILAACLLYDWYLRRRAQRAPSA